MHSNGTWRRLVVREPLLLDFANICIGVIFFFCSTISANVTVSRVIAENEAENRFLSIFLSFAKMNSFRYHFHLQNLVKSRTSDANDPELFTNQYHFHEPPSVIGLQISAAKIDHARLNVTLPSTVFRDFDGGKSFAGNFTCFYSDFFARKQNTESFIVSIVTVSITVVMSSSIRCLSNVLCHLEERK